MSFLGKKKLILVGKILSFRIICLSFLENLLEFFWPWVFFEMSKKSLTNSLKMSRFEKEKMNSRKAVMVVLPKSGAFKNPAMGRICRLIGAIFCPNRSRRHSFYASDCFLAHQIKINPIKRLDNQILHSSIKIHTQISKH